MSLSSVLILVGLIVAFLLLTAIGLWRAGIDQRTAEMEKRNKEMEKKL
jgi:FtsZ-interacting cell division protein ZipA